MLSVQEIQGVDLDPGRRPGYAGFRPVAPWPNARMPPAQQPGEPASMPRRRRETTPVFGTANPPHGLSGAVRRLAYRFPEYRARHWLLLLAADRVEATPARLRRLATFGLPLALAAAGATVARRRKGLRRAAPRRSATPPTRYAARALRATEAPPPVAGAW
jgi:hypothetical protein